MVEKLIAIQSELKAPKNQYNEFGKYNYRNAEDILEAVKPLLKKYELALTLRDEIVEVGGRIYVKAIAALFDGKDRIETCAFAREEDAKKGMDSSQVTGSTSSYARKYALNGLFCIDDTKDSDATNTGDAPPKKEAKKDAPKEKQVGGEWLCEKCHKPIIAYKGKNGGMVYPAAHAEGSKKKFGKILCLDCINALG